MIYEFQDNIKISYETESKEVLEDFIEDKYLETLKSFFDLKSELDKNTVFWLIYIN
jgi:hypothetical protein